jgi:hypothetical protein
VEHECVAVEDDEAAVRLGGPEGWVRVWNRVVDESLYPLSAFCIEIGAGEMTARLHKVVLHNGGPEKFVAEVAESYEGWSGEKTWQSLSRDLTIKAVFKTWGYVDMTWALAPQSMFIDWRAEVTVRGIQAGEEMRRLAEDMGALLG